MSAAMRDERAPLPTLTYAWLRRNGDDVRGDGPPLYDVCEVRVSLTASGIQHVYARGRMLRKDGHAGPSRGLRVDYLHRGQPDWLLAIIEDAQRRADPTPEPQP